jgi:cell division protein FtsB
VRRWLALILIAMIGYAYYHPLRSWLETRVRTSESLDSVAKQARQLGYIRPGEHLFIVKGIKAWEKAHSTIKGGGH